MKDEVFGSRVIYVTGVLKGKEVRQMVEEFRAQESIRPMTNRILRENNCLQSKKATGQSDFSATHLENVPGDIIPVHEHADKEVSTYV
ncbi:hypothetical protein ACHHV8_36480 [Paenibacillus sp. TAB 01]|uniref:hypothetical protein n=1 Tax=Paenibacillus sp. TAB 01 TaxID=3368988 RepID=UPI003752770D